MPAWLTSVESLNKIYNCAQLLGIAFALATAICALAGFLASVRISSLHAKNEGRLRERLSTAEKINTEIGTKLQNTMKAQAELEKRAQTAEQKAESAIAQAAEQKTESANAQAEEARRLTAPRETTEPRSAVEKLRQYSGQKLQVRILGDQETNRLANQIIRILEASGWKLNISITGMTSPPLYGLIISVPNPDIPPPAARALAVAFGEHTGGVHFRAQPIGKDNMEMVIGLKPVR